MLERPLGNCTLNGSRKAQWVVHKLSMADEVVNWCSRKVNPGNSKNSCVRHGAIEGIGRQGRDMARQQTASYLAVARGARKVVLAFDGFLAAELDTTMINGGHAIDIFAIL